jgi:hypothetical protein
VIDYITAEAGAEAVQAVMSGAEAAAKRVYGTP